MRTLTGPQARTDDDPPTDQGVILIWVGLMVTVLLGVGALVVDLGAMYRVRVRLKWTNGPTPPHTVTYSVDGRTYGEVGNARYVAVSTGWRPGHAVLKSLSANELF